MLDDQTMRIVLGGVTLTVLVLFFFGVYRPTRSRFALWWTLALVFAAAARAMLMFSGRDARVVMIPLSSMLAVTGVTCVWFATRTLRRKPLPLWLLAAVPLAILVPTLVEDADGGMRIGNGVLFIYMASMFVIASVETWLAWKERRSSVESEPNREPVVALLVTAVAGTALAAYYAVRAVMQVIIVPGEEAPGLGAGSGWNSVILLISLVAITFSVASVSWDQTTHELRLRAVQDDLTGLLGRSEFRMRAERSVASARSGGTEAVLVIGDLDHFKEVNDVHGHAAGDSALVAFAAILKDSIGPGEFAGRLGGDEFAAVLHDLADADALVRVEAIREEFAAIPRSGDFSMPTVSFGLAKLGDGDTVAEIYERADLALYRAKAAGRDRAVRYSRGDIASAELAPGTQATDEAPPAIAASS